MNIYLLNWVVLLTLGVTSRIKKVILVLEKHRVCIYNVIAYVTVFLLMFLEMGLRGDFSTDMGSYYYLFKRSKIENIDVGLLGDQGFLFLIWIINQISESYLLFLCLIAFVMAFCYVKFMKKESDSFWLSAFILFCSGSFYSGFNVMRQFLAAACFSLCIKYIIEKKFFKYAAFVVLLTSLHSSAIFMLASYFFMNYHWREDRKTTVKIIIVVVILGVILYFSTDWILKYITQFIYFQYRSGHNVEGGVSVLGTLKAVVMSGVVILNGRLFDKTNPKERVIYNGCILYLLVALCGFKIFIIQRFSHYFIPCLVLAYPLMLSKIERKVTRRLWTVAVVMLFMLLSVNVVMDSNYYFFWDNQFIVW